ncbi:trypsin-like peptidase domain-containing protein [Aquisphaera insulae]|uniref:trypsin-like peptidase domain-containing protein n=1 Tax=Aquisphaera insulae TaxID=2712864 RepID=UPI0013ED7773|nr:trypsin-like peptidase domain-containing protein [Aquisphaera insulae]
MAISSAWFAGRHRSLLVPTLLAIFVCTRAGTAGAQSADLDTQLMLATVKVADPDATGTGFLLSRPSPKDPKATQFLLVTAEHTLARTKGEDVTLFFHKRRPNGLYEKAPVKVRVRQEGKVLWKKHPELDVGVIAVVPPAEAVPPAVPVDLLASDADLEKYEIHPGDAVRCVGFPHPNQFEASEAGFGVVRGGFIAGFPLLPTKATQTFLVDLNTFEGDSGAPVYLVDLQRLLQAKPEPARVRLILGLMVGQHFLDEEFKAIYQTSKFRHRMGFGIVVHATAIRETVEMLDAKP